MKNLSGKPKKTVYIQTRIDPEIKEKTENILQKLGISPSQAINMLYYQICLQKAIPFDISIPDYMTEEEERQVASSREDLKKGKYKIYDPEKDTSLDDILEGDV